MDEYLKFYSKALYIIEGTAVTLKYSLCAAVFGCIIAIILAIFKVSHFKLLRLLADLYTSLFRGTPILIQLSIIYFAMPSIIGIKLPVFTAGVIAFSLNSGAYVSEAIRGGINSIDKGQFEAAKVLSIPKYLMMRDIILPQAIRNILPSLINELINLIKETAIISIIGETDIMRRAQLVSTESLNFFTPMLIAAANYYILVLIIGYIGKIIEKRFKYD